MRSDSSSWRQVLENFSSPEIGRSLSGCSSGCAEGGGGLGSKKVLEISEGE